MSELRADEIRSTQALKTTAPPAPRTPVPSAPVAATPAPVAPAPAAASPDLEVLTAAPTATPAPTTPRRGRPPAGRAIRGYDRGEVDRFIARCAQALTPSGDQAHSLDQIPHRRVTREEVTSVLFHWGWFGYDAGEVDRLLERVARVLPETTADPVAVPPPAVLPAAWFGYATREVSSFLWLCQQVMGQRAVEVGLPASQGQPIKLAPEAVRQAVFSRSLRGFKMGPIDALLDDIEMWLRTRG